jgi:hypothetical protein
VENRRAKYPAYVVIGQKLHRTKAHSMSHDNITDIYTYLRQFGPLLAERILETYPPLQSTKDPVAPFLGMLLRKALPDQALAITGTAKYLRQAKAARIVAECGAGKTFMALGTVHVLTEGRPSTTLVMCPSLRCSRLIGRAFNEWRRSNTSAGTCAVGSTLLSPMNCTNWLVTRRKATDLACSDARRRGYRLLWLREHDTRSYNENLALGRRYTMYWDDPALKMPASESSPFK